MNSKKSPILAEINQTKLQYICLRHRFIKLSGEKKGLKLYVDLHHMMFSPHFPASPVQKSPSQQSRAITMDGIVVEELI